MDSEELESEDFRAELEAKELEIELEPLDLGLLEYGLEDLFSWLSQDISVFQVQWRALSSWARKCMSQRLLGFLW